jgi:hypothetical protein
MAKNTGNGSRVSSFNNRAQVLNTKTDRYVKRDTTTGQFINQKSDDKPFKRVAKELDERRSDMSIKVDTHPYFSMNSDAQEPVEETVNCLRSSRSLTTQEFIERFAGSMPNFPDIEKLEVQEREHI